VNQLARPWCVECCQQLLQLDFVVGAKHHDGERERARLAPQVLYIVTVAVGNTVLSKLALTLHALRHDAQRHAPIRGI